MSLSQENLIGWRKYPFDAKLLNNFYYFFLPSIETIDFEKQPTVGKSLSLTIVNSYAGASQARVIPSTSYTPNRHKRSYEEDDEMDAQTQPNEEISGKKIFCFLLTHSEGIVIKACPGAAQMDAVH